MSFGQSDFGGGSGWVIFGTGTTWYGGSIPCTKIEKKQLTEKNEKKPVL